MGSWDSGNFDGDEPRDTLADLVAVWERIIDRALASDMEGVAACFGPDARPSSATGQEAVDAFVMPTAEVLILVADRLPCDYLPEPEKVAAWKAEALRIYDAEGVHGWDDPDRRSVIADTFDRLARLAARGGDET